ncbi:unnamed protein product [Dovyalis caffra]|uniref:Uncharacterized protein n=1 Tax=Dovyalis caffra TaxID=77055 RepID=A0AAV1RC26_9ROSI|nr:unnamed protein product [Dovyalis caffra]
MESSKISACRHTKVINSDQKEVTESVTYARKAFLKLLEENSQGFAIVPDHQAGAKSKPKECKCKN